MLKLRYFPPLMNAFKKLRVNQVSVGETFFLLPIIAKACFSFFHRNFYRKLKAALELRGTKTKIFCDARGFLKFRYTTFWYIQMLIKSAKFRLCNMKEF